MWCQYRPIIEILISPIVEINSTILLIKIIVICCISTTVRWKAFRKVSVYNFQLNNYNKTR